MSWRAQTLWERPGHSLVWAWRPGSLRAPRAGHAVPFPGRPVPVWEGSVCASMQSPTVLLLPSAQVPRPCRCPRGAGGSHGPTVCAGGPQIPAVDGEVGRTSFCPPFCPLPAGAPCPPPAEGAAACSAGPPLGGAVHTHLLLVSGWCPGSAYSPLRTGVLRYRVTPSVSRVKAVCRRLCSSFRFFPSSPSSLRGRYSSVQWRRGHPAFTPGPLEPSSWLGTRWECWSCTGSPGEAAVLPPACSSQVHPWSPQALHPSWPTSLSLSLPPWRA